MALEPILGEIERLAGRASWARRKPLLYWFAVFGEPGGREPWSWRVGGHHVAVHVTLVDAGFVAATPLFFGANPVAVLHGPHAGLRTLGAGGGSGARAARPAARRSESHRHRRSRRARRHPDEELSQRRCEQHRARRRLRTARRRAARVAGAARCGTTSSARAPDIAAAEWRRIEAAGLAQVTFAWAGPAGARTGALLRRSRGPRFLIENTTTRQNDANHIHAVWRDFTNDWGEDLLAAHYATEPRTARDALIGTPTRL